ncbi:putative ATP binding protein, partial [Toxoplasma gondii MAS]
MWYGQLVIGPPGSGKSTYCNGMQQMLRALHRPHIVVNLDPANDFLPYDCAVNLRDLIDHKEVMEKHRLGPNGGMSLLSPLLSRSLVRPTALFSPLVLSPLFSRFCLLVLACTFVFSLSFFTSMASPSHPLAPEHPPCRGSKAFCGNAHSNSLLQTASVCSSRAVHLTPQSSPPSVSPHTLRRQPSFFDLRFH